MTGPWPDPARKLHYDNLYIDAMGPWLDLKLCVLCVLNALRPRRPGRTRRPVRVP